MLGEHGAWRWEAVVEGPGRVIIERVEVGQVGGGRRGGRGLQTGLGDGRRGEGHVEPGVGFQLGLGVGVLEVRGTRVDDDGGGRRGSGGGCGGGGSLAARGDGGGGEGGRRAAGLALTGLGLLLYPTARPSLGRVWRV